MAKTNYTKVEEVLNEGLRKIKVNQLLEEADAAAAVGGSQEMQEREGAPTDETGRTHLIATLKHDLKQLHKQKHDPYEKLGLKKSELNKFLDNQEALTPQDWEMIKQLRKRIDEFKEELAKNLPSTTDDDLIKQARRKHINKRFNVNEKWLPLK